MIEFFKSGFWRLVFAPARKEPGWNEPAGIQLLNYHADAQYTGWLPVYTGTDPDMIEAFGKALMEAAAVLRKEVDG